MSRPDLAPPPVDPRVAEKMARFHADTLDEVRRALAEHDVVVLGMGWNPHVRRARRALDAAGVAFHYIGYGNYLTGWRPRLAIKLWSGWPTFPQVYVHGVLIGGADQLADALADGSLQGRLAEPSRATGS